MLKVIPRFALMLLLMTHLIGVVGCVTITSEEVSFKEFVMFYDGGRLEYDIFTESFVI
jgi:hypothetical protein